MMRFLLFFLLCLICATGYGQTAQDKDLLNPTSYQIELQQVAGKDSLQLVDSTFGYRVMVPKWWQIRSTPPDMFGGILPAIDSVVNSLVFKCYAKDQFRKMIDFEKWVIAGYKPGESPAWNPQQIILSRKKTADFIKTGISYRVQVQRSNRIYENCFILTETKKAFIWIDYSSTKATYARNFAKLRQILGWYKKL